VGKAQSGSPVAACGRIYIADQEGTTHVIEASPEFKVIATNKLDKVTAADKLNDGCMASPAVVDGAIFLRTKTHLYCIGR